MLFFFASCCGKMLYQCNFGVKRFVPILIHLYLKSDRLASINYLRNERKKSSITMPQLNYALREAQTNIQQWFDTQHTHTHKRMM